MRIGIALVPALTLSHLLAAPAVADPMDWPAEGAAEAEVAFHCAAVMTALGQAYTFAAELMEVEDPPRPATLPARLLDVAGGEARLQEILDMVAGWRDHWESMGRTSFYPRLAQSGTPYVADEGEILYDNVTRCVDRFHL